MYQCAIIGGGLGGLTLAISLAQNGISVILFEREKYPFHKVCGEYISMESYNFLERCGIPLSTMQVPRITELTVSAPSGLALATPLNPGGFGISRYKLDAMLADQAKKLGVYLMEATKVLDYQKKPDSGYTVRTEQHSYTAQLVIAAWGKRSNLDVVYGRNFIQKPLPAHRNYIGVKYHIKYPITNHQIALHNFEDGYCGISKVSNDVCCLCYLTTAANLQKYGSIKNLEYKVLYQNPHLKAIFTEAEFLFDEPLSIAQINFSDKTTHDANTLFAGDAAGLITPLCGNGMSMAMHSASILHSLLQKYYRGALSETELFNAYDKQWKRIFGRRIQIGRWIQYSFGRPMLTNLVLRLFKPFPGLVKSLIAQTHGRPF